MARTAAERRAARRRKQQDRSRTRATGGVEQESRDEVIRRLVATGTAAAVGPDASPELLADVVGHLAATDADVDSAGCAAGLLLTLLAGLWQDGWQPADVAHVIRRGGSARQVRLLVSAIAAQAQAAGAWERAPQAWTEQLRRVGADTGSSRLSVGAWRREEGLAAAEAWREALVLVGLLGTLGRVEQLTPPPTSWGRTGRRAGAPHRGGDPRGLGRIRGLLAKAESTDFPEEAEALTAKAQELMTRYAVDTAVLEVAHGTRLADEVIGRRVHLDNPYPEEKARLLTAVGRANGVKVVWHDAFGMATAVGCRSTSTSSSCWSPRCSCRPPGR